MDLAQKWYLSSIPVIDLQSIHLSSALPKGLIQEKYCISKRRWNLSIWELFHSVTVMLHVMNIIVGEKSTLSRTLHLKCRLHFHCLHHSLQTLPGTSSELNF